MPRDRSKPSSPEAAPVVGVRYVGDEPGRIRIGDRPVMPGDIISGPPDVVEALRKRGDFVVVEQKQEVEE